MVYIQMIATRFIKLIAMGILATSAVLMVASCTPADEAYCNRYGVQGTAEFGKCLDYAHQQEAAFKADFAVCSLAADGTYPPTLYDYGHDVPVMGHYGPHGEWYGGGVEHIPPDYMHNAQVDNLRMRIIGPCMQAHGWNSATDWQSGHHAVSAPPRPLPPQKLPWQ